MFFLCFDRANRLIYVLDSNVERDAYLQAHDHTFEDYESACDDAVAYVGLNPFWLLELTEAEIEASKVRLAKKEKEANEQAMKHWRENAEHYCFSPFRNRRNDF